MGLDLLEITLRIEKSFGIEVSHSELIKDRDICVGDLYQQILMKHSLLKEVRNDLGVNFSLWRELRSTIGAVTQHQVDEVLLSTPLKELFPQKSRRKYWSALQAASSYSIRELDYAPVIRVVALLLAGVVVYAELAKVWQFWWWLWPILGIFSLWVFIETHAKMLKVLEPWRNSLPSRMITVKDLCRSVIADNYQELNENIYVAYELSDPDQIVWKQLVEILVETLGVDADQIAFDSLLIRDLDMN